MERSNSCGAGRLSFEMVNMVAQAKVVYRNARRPARARSSPSRQFWTLTPPGSARKSAGVCKRGWSAWCSTSAQWVAALWSSWACTHKDEVRFDPRFASGCLDLYASVHEQPRVLASPPCHHRFPPVVRVRIAYVRNAAPALCWRRRDPMQGSRCNKMRRSAFFRVPLVRVLAAVPESVVFLPRAMPVVICTLTMSQPPQRPARPSHACARLPCTLSLTRPPVLQSR